MDLYTFWNETAARGGSEADNMTTPPDTIIFLAFNCAILSLTLVLGLPGNLLVCWVVCRTKSLRTSDNNALLVSLAAGDLIKCAVDTPLLLSSMLRYYGAQQGAPLPSSLCALQQFIYALCSCVQLLTLVGISVDRFQAIAHPFQTERRKARIRLWILSIWACGLALAVVSLALSSKQAVFYMFCRRLQVWGRFDAEAEQQQHADYATDPFGAYVLVPVWGCSLTMIIVHYLRIFRIVRRHSKKVFDGGVRLRPAAAGHVWSWLSLTAGGGKTSAPGTVPAAAAAAAAAPWTTLAPWTAPTDSSLPAAVQGSSSGAQRHAVITVAEATSPPPSSGPSSGEKNRSAKRSTATAMASAPRPEIVGAVCLLTPHARERGKKRMEGKLAKRFLYIIIAFTLFWMPMVVTLLINIISGHGPDLFFMELETSAMVLTCVPAAVDPLIYTMVTRQFRSEFSKILSSTPGCLRLRLKG